MAQIRCESSQICSTNPQIRGQSGGTSLADRAESVRSNSSACSSARAMARSLDDSSAAERGGALAQASSSKKAVSAGFIGPAPQG